MKKNCANKDKSIPFKNKAFTTTLHNCHYATIDKFIPQNVFKKFDYWNIVVYCGLDKYFEGSDPIYKTLRCFLIKKRILNRNKGWNVSRMQLLHTIKIVKTTWIDDDEELPF